MRQRGLEICAFVGVELAGSPFADPGGVDMRRELVACLVVKRESEESKNFLGLTRRVGA